MLGIVGGELFLAYCKIACNRETSRRLTRVLRGAANDDELARLNELLLLKHGSGFLSFALSVIGQRSTHANTQLAFNSNFVASFGLSKHGMNKLAESYQVLGYSSYSLRRIEETERQREINRYRTHFLLF